MDKSLFKLDELQELEALEVRGGNADSIMAQNECKNYATGCGEGPDQIACENHVTGCNGVKPIAFGGCTFPSCIQTDCPITIDPTPGL